MAIACNPATPAPITSTLAGAIVPALVFSASNGAMEELLYRGALQGWAARAIGRSGAFVFQAAVFGFAHAGPDFVASPDYQAYLRTGDTPTDVAPFDSSSTADPVAL